jgi:hypothetical protein
MYALCACAATQARAVRRAHLALLEDGHALLHRSDERAHGRRMRTINGSGVQRAPLGRRLHRTGWLRCVEGKSSAGRPQHSETARKTGVAAIALRSAVQRSAAKRNRRPFGFGFGVAL